MVSLAKVDFRLPYTVREEGKWFYSACPILDVHSQGRSRDEAVQNLIEAIQMFLESCFERGTLSNVLLASGFMPGDLQAAQEENEMEEPDNGYLDVPLSLVARVRAEAHAN